MTAPISAMLERVEAGSGPVSDGEWRTLYRAAIGSPDSITFQHFLAAIEGSLDHAVAFTEAALPGAKKLIREESKQWVTTHWRAVLEHQNSPYTSVGDAPTPALALVIATLRALRDGAA